MGAKVVQIERNTKFIWIFPRYISLTMTPMTPMTPTYFCHRSRKKVLIIQYNIYIIYNNAIANYPQHGKINTPTVIGVIVIAVIDCRTRVGILCLEFRGYFCQVCKTLSQIRFAFLRGRNFFTVIRFAFLPGRNFFNEIRFITLQGWQNRP